MCSLTMTSSRDPQSSLLPQSLRDVKIGVLVKTPADFDRKAFLKHVIQENKEMNVYMTIVHIKSCKTPFFVHMCVLKFQ